MDQALRANPNFVRCAKRWRRARDSNPGGRSLALAVFKTAALGHYASPPVMRTHCGRAWRVGREVPVAATGPGTLEVSDEDPADVRSRTGSPERGRLPGGQGRPARDGAI